MCELHGWQLRETGTWSTTTEVPGGHGDSHWSGTVSWWLLADGRIAELKATSGNTYRIDQEKWASDKKRSPDSGTELPYLNAVIPNVATFLEAHPTRSHSVLELVRRDEG